MTAQAPKFNKETCRTRCS